MCPLLFVSWRISANIGKFVNKSACLYPDSGKFGNNGLYFPMSFAIVYENQLLKIWLI